MVVDSCWGRFTGVANNDASFGVWIGLFPLEAHFFADYVSSYQPYNHT